jgi:cell division cycle 20-like protein 1, cofactor of APC complex
MFINSPATQGGE